MINQLLPLVLVILSGLAITIVGEATILLLLAVVGVYLVYRNFDKDKWNNTVDNITTTLEGEVPYKKQAVDIDISALIDAQRAKDRAHFYTTDMLSIPQHLLDEYKHYLGTDEWMLLRYSALDRDSYACQQCGSPNNLEVHHTSYEGIYEMNFKLEQLTTLCEPCHKEEHITLKL